MSSLAEPECVRNAHLENVLVSYFLAPKPPPLLRGRVGRAHAVSQSSEPPRTSFVGAKKASDHSTEKFFANLVSQAALPAHQTSGRAKGALYRRHTERESACNAAVVTAERLREVAAQRCSPSRFIARFSCTSLANISVCTLSSNAAPDQAVGKDLRQFAPTRPACRPAKPPPQQRIRLRLRQRYHASSIGNSNSPASWPSPSSSSSHLHPLWVLRRLGSAAFGDLPLSLLTKYLTIPSHRAKRVKPVLRSSSEQSRHQKLPELCAIHLGDVEARTYRVQILFGESPIQPLVDAYDGCLWDGSEFFVIPLLDERRTPLETLPTLMMESAEKGYPDWSVITRAGSRDGATTASPSGSPTCFQLPEMPVNFLRSATNSFRTGVPMATEVSPPVTHAVSPELFSNLTVVNSGGAYSAMTGAPSSSSSLPINRCWRRFCTTASLYLVLGEAGFCDTDRFPFFGMQLCKMGDLLSYPSTVMEIKSSCSPAGLAALRSSLDEQDPGIPAALMFPTARKGIMRRPLELSTQPFTDAEVFQLFYLQLIFRAFFDVRFPGMTFSITGVGGNHLRSDLISVHSGGPRPLAYHHPGKPGRWLRFPAHSRVLTLLCLDDAVVPPLATTSDLHETSSVPLFGGGENLPCVTTLGRQVASWADTVDINSPAAAQTALLTLFTMMEPMYGCTRSQLWASPVLPRVYRCDEDSGFTALKQSCGTLFHCLVSQHRRRRDRNANQASSFTDGELSSSTCATASVYEVPSLLKSVASPMQVTPDRLESGVDFLEACIDSEGGALESMQNQSFTVAFGNSLLTTMAPSTSCIEGMPHASSPLGDDTSAVTEAIESAAPPKQKNTAIAAEESSGALTCAVSSDKAVFYSREGTLVRRWRLYVNSGNLDIFNGETSNIQLHGFLGRGGSGIVYHGLYGETKIPVAVKVFVIPDGVAHDDYVRECLTDVAFYVLLNQMEDFGLYRGGRAYDFVVSSTMPNGLAEEDAASARRGGDVATTRLCYLVTDVMDGTVGRFLTESDDDFDPCYDTLMNTELRDGELFQFLFLQLAIKALFDWRVLDLMLNYQLRGDNVGYRFVVSPLISGHCAEGHSQSLKRQYGSRMDYKGIIYAFQFDSSAPMQYLRFDANLEPEDPKLGPLRLLHLIDLGQGMQPHVAQLVEKRYIGETVIDSCVEDCGLGRYWPLNELYCKYVEVKGRLSGDVSSWGSALRINSKEEALDALKELFLMYYPAYGVAAPTVEEQNSYLILSWNVASIKNLRRANVYDPE